jgi:hypothetical protein
MCITQNLQLSDNTSRLLCLEAVADTVHTRLSSHVHLALDPDW